MERQDNKQTANTLLEYYKSNIDIHIDYLLTLNNYKSISHIGYLELAPILERIRRELYDKVESYPDKNIYAQSINKIIVIELSLILATKGIDDVIDYIAYDMSEYECISLVVASTLNKVIKHIPELKASNDLELTISSMLKDLELTLPSTNLSINGLPECFIEEYTDKIRISHDDSTTILKYIYETISTLSGIIHIFKQLYPSDIDTEAINKLLTELNEYMRVYDIDSLTRVLDMINNLVRKTNSNKVEKQLQYDKISK